MREPHAIAIPDLRSRESQQNHTLSATQLSTDDSTCAFSAALLIRFYRSTESTRHDYYPKFIFCAPCTKSISGQSV